MFYEQLKKACKEKNTTITAVLKKIGVGTANGTYWKNGSVPSSDIVIQLSEFLNVSTDYLLTGKDNQENPSIKFTNSNEETMMKLFRLLTEKEQDRIIGRLEAMVEQSQEIKNKEVV